MLIYTDGACSGNPGPMGIGVAIYKGGRLLKEISEAMGEGTNNVAEYLAVRVALEEGISLGADAIEVRTDSRLIVQQLSGKFRVKSANLRGIKKEIDDLADGLDVTYTWVPREKNSVADRLAKDAIG
jgi:ribonuclease HI